MSRSAMLALALLSSCVFTTAADAASRTLQVIVAKDTQSLAVYDGDRVIATSKVSTGKEGHETPTGIFSILEKQKFHRSNIYSNAPMPWMQRLTWSGIALHESDSVPRHPASHGCVRLPGAFARELYGMTDRGVHVIITDAAVEPRVISHANLFEPQAPVPDLLSDVPLRPSTVGVTMQEVQVAMHVPKPEIDPTAPSPKKAEEAEPQPIRILITRRTERDNIADIQSMLTELGFDAGEPDGVVGSATRTAFRATSAGRACPKRGRFSPMR